VWGGGVGQVWRLGTDGLIVSRLPAECPRQRSECIPALAEGIMD